MRKLPKGYHRFLNIIIYTPIKALLNILTHSSSKVLISRNFEILHKLNKKKLFMKLETAFYMNFIFASFKNINPTQNAQNIDFNEIIC